MRNAVEFQNVYKSLGSKKVFRDFNLAIPAGVITSIVGESGSGKTTLLSLINGVGFADSGSISVFGEAITRENLLQTQRRIGYAVQGAGLFPHLTAEENISLVARSIGMKSDWIKKRVGVLADLVNLDQQLLKNFPHALSGGQQQRVGLCRAMMLNPSLILLDEPFSSLDPITRRALHSEIIPLQKATSATVVIVSHDISEAIKLGQWIVVIKEGALVQANSPENIISRPHNQYVVDLLEAMS